MNRSIVKQLTTLMRRSVARKWHSYFIKGVVRLRCKTIIKCGQVVARPDYNCFINCWIKKIISTHINIYDAIKGVIKFRCQSERWSRLCVSRYLLRYGLAIIKQLDTNVNTDTLLFLVFVFDCLHVLLLSLNAILHI